MDHPYQESAHGVGVHLSTISREVRRNRGQRGYRPRQAHRITLNRRPTKARRRDCGCHVALCQCLLKAEWSPEQISGWLRTQQGAFVSLEWIDQPVYGDEQAQGTLFRHLRCQRRRRKR